MTLDAIDRAVNAGARLESACEELGLSARTIQRWRAQGGGGDLRVGGVSPANKLSDEERALVLAKANSNEFRDVGPKQIVPVLADRAEYVAAESTFYRLLRGAGQMTHREPSRPAAVRPRELTATAPCPVWSWDLTYLRGPVLGEFFYLYLIVDVFSRKVVAARVHADEDMALSAALMADTCEREKIEARQLSLHSDNGSPMKGATMLATLQKLGVAASFSRIHQDYGDHARKAVIESFTDGIQLWNPGDSFADEKRLLDPGEKDVRNPAIAMAIRRIGMCEQADTGLRMMQREWQALGHAPPVNTNDRARTLVFAPADRRVSTFTDLGGGLEGVRLADTPLGRVVQVRVPLPGAPIATVDDGLGPSAWANIYAVHRSVFPVTRQAGPGLVWQEAGTVAAHVTWLSDERPGDASTQPLAGGEVGALLGASADSDGTVTALFVQVGSGRPETARAVAVVGTGPDGREVRRVALDAGRGALDIVEFGEQDVRGNHGAMVRSRGHYAVMFTRTIHRTNDGLNHQSGSVFLLDAETLERVSDVPQTSGHSFANALLADGPDRFLGVDVGDNYPRGIHLHRFASAPEPLMRSRVIFTFKTQHGDTALSPDGRTYPVYEDISGEGRTYCRWSNDNRTYTELGGLAKTPQGIVVTFATERSLLNNSRVGADWNETRELAMVRVREDFEAAGAGPAAEWVTDDLVRSAGEPPVEGRFYTFGGTESRQRVAGVVFLTALGAQESASRPKLHHGPGGLTALYEVWRTTAPAGGEGLVDSYVETRALRLGDDGLPVAGQSAVLGRTVRLGNRDEAFSVAGGVAVAEAQRAERALVLTVVLPPR